MEGEEHLLYSGNTLFKCVNSIFKRELELYLPKNPRSDAGKELKNSKERINKVIQKWGRYPHLRTILTAKTIDYYFTYLNFNKKY